jgi:hypothetical protein
VSSRLALTVAVLVAVISFGGIGAVTLIAVRPSPASPP